VADELLREHAEDILEVVLLEHAVGGKLQLRNKHSQEFWIPFKHLSNELGLGFKICEETFNVSHFYETSSVRVIPLPNALEAHYMPLEDLDALLLVRVHETIEDNCDEEVQENDGHYQLEKDPIQVRK
jgi:hypothetical protein